MSDIEQLKSRLMELWDSSEETHSVFRQTMAQLNLSRGVADRMNLKSRCADIEERYDLTMDELRSVYSTLSIHGIDCMDYIDGVLEERKRSGQ